MAVRGPHSAFAMDRSPATWTRERNPAPGGRWSSEAGKLYLFESNSYHYNTTDVPSLPNPNNIHVEESFNNYTQLDWNLNASHRLTAVFAADPSEVDFATINTFNPQPVTADYRQRSFFTSLTDRWILPVEGLSSLCFQLNDSTRTSIPPTRWVRRWCSFPSRILAHTSIRSGVAPGSTSGRRACTCGHSNRKDGIS